MNRSKEERKDAEVISIRRTDRKPPRARETDLAQRNQLVSNQVVGILRNMFSSFRSELQPQQS